MFPSSTPTPNGAVCRLRLGAPNPGRDLPLQFRAGKETTGPNPHLVGEVLKAQTELLLWMGGRGNAQTWAGTKR